MAQVSYIPLSKDISITYITSSKIPQNPLKRISQNDPKSNTIIKDEQKHKKSPDLVKPNKKGKTEPLNPLSSEIKQAKHIHPARIYSDNCVLYLQSFVKIDTKIPIVKSHNDTCLLYVKDKTIRSLKTVRSIDKYKHKDEDPWTKHYGEVINTYKGKALLVNRKQASLFEHKLILNLPEINQKDDNSFKIFEK